jgi:hypothetical protein
MSVNDHSLLVTPAAIAGVILRLLWKLTHYPSFGYLRRDEPARLFRLFSAGNLQGLVPFVVSAKAGTQGGRRTADISGKKLRRFYRQLSLPVSPARRADCRPAGPPLSAISRGYSTMIWPYIQGCGVQM